jgi:hypothetical protein
VLPEFINGRLKHGAVTLPVGWDSWERKSLNMHRAVLHWDATGRKHTLDEIRDEVRTIVRERFRPSWWRGFGFGVIVSLADADDSLRDAFSLIDTRNNRAGVWQWLVLHFPALRMALGVRTWTEGFLAPVYRDLSAALRADGFTCEDHQKDMDALFKAIIAVKKQLSVLHHAGTIARAVLRPKEPE